MFLNQLAPARGISEKRDILLPFSRSKISMGWSVALEVRLSAVADDAGSNDEWHMAILDERTVVKTCFKK